MITIPLSNNTELNISISLIDKVVTIRQSSKQTNIQSVAPDPVIRIPMVDLKELAKSIKTLVGFFS
jgi:hypothetical protein